VLKAGSPSSSAIGRLYNLQEVWPNGKNLGHWGHALEKDVGTLTPSCLSLLPRYHEVNRPPLPCHTVLPQAHSNRAKQPWAETVS
jgi:hypothetical protein